MNPAPLACCLMTIGLMAGSAAAQTEKRSAQLWRCGPEGRELRDSPCPTGPQAAGKPLDYDAPSAAQQQEAGAIARRDARLARQMEQERLRQEREATRPAIGIHGRGKPPAPQQAAASAPASDKPLTTKKPRLKKPKPPKTGGSAPGSG